MLIYLATILYHTLNTLRNSYYSHVKEPFSPGIPVISIGGFAAGGSGKTPFAVYLSALMARTGMKVALVSHSYLSRLRESCVVSYTMRDAPDEARLQAFIFRDEERVDVIAGPTKKEALRFVQGGPWDICIIDDALTSFYIARDVDIAVISEGEFSVRGNSLIPARIMRMMPSRGDKRIIKVLRRSDELKKWFHGPVFFTMERHVFYSWDLNVKIENSSFSGKEAICVAGIADPQRFFRDMKKYFNVKQTISLKDHRQLSRRTVEKLAELTEKSGGFLVMTLKDRIKISVDDFPPLLKKRCVVVDVELEVENESEFLNCVMRRLEDAGYNF